MDDRITVDASEMDLLAADLGRIPARLLPGVDAILKKAADNIKKDLRGQALFSPHFAPMAESMSYDSHYRFGQVAYEVGPDRSRGPAGRSAHLANIFFFGGANGGGGKGDLDGALRTEEPQMMKRLDEFLAGLL
jgi:hypothetical protein